MLLPNLKLVAEETGSSVPAIRYGFRLLDRQWLLPDSRLINQPNPELWESRSDQQLYLTAFSEESPTSGPALTFTGLVPDLHHYKGSFGGRVFPLWRNREASEPNFKAAILALLADRYKKPVNAEDFFAYIAAIAANKAYTAMFQEDLSTPGLRIPITADAELFSRTAELGRQVLWLYTFGERFTDLEKGRPAHPPRLPVEKRPAVPKAGAISQDADDMPDTIGYDAGKHRLLVGRGFIDNVTPAMWAYEVSGKQVLTQWFSYRKRNRERPMIGDRRKPSALGDIQPDHWLPEYTTELLNVLNILGLLIDLESQQADLLERVCSGPLISAQDLPASQVADQVLKPQRPKKKGNGTAPLFA